MRVKREDERAELRWKLWLREKAILVWARLMEEMIKAGEIVGTVQSEWKGTGTVYHCDANS